jgi:endo-1,4-beta-xylanase
MRYPHSRRRRTHVLLAGSFPVVLSLAAAARGQTTVNGSSLILHSSGAVSGTTGWALSTNGYLGTYVQLTQPGPITFTAAASGASSGGVAPEMTFAIADYKQSFNLTSTPSNYTFTTPTLPAGTYTIRTQLDNQNATAQPTMTLASLKVAGTGTSVLNTSTDANALAAANTYIDNFRKGPATISFTTAGNNPLPANTSVQVQLTRNAFHFGTNVWGNNQTDINNLLASNPAPGSLADNYQQFISQHFNSMVASNVGKWGDDESNQGVQTMGASDTVLSFAKAHNMTAREHNLVWGMQQPSWVNTLLTNAQSSDPTTAANAKASLSSAITSRIGYYIGGTVTGSTDKRGADFIEMDGLNESLHTGPYWKIYGASGIADIYHQSVQALVAAGSHAGVYLNEFNVFQNSPQSINTNVPAGSNPTQSGSDAYANWYRQNVEDLNNAGFGKVVTGIGAQYYPTASGAAPSAARINQVMQNLGIEGLPITLTEFGVQSTEPTSAAPQILEDAMRMMFGSPDATGFYNWGWWAGATSNLGSSGVMVNTTWKNPDGSWNLTPTGTRYEWIFGMNTDSVTGGHNSVNPDPWTTNLTLTTDANGRINFNGFYGDYMITLQGRSYNLSLTKGGTSSFTIQAIPNGPVWILNTGGSFATAGNWGNNVIPGGIGGEADFLDAIQADSTITLNGGTTLGTVVFNNPHTYTLGGGASASITMKTSSGPATINLQAGATQQISVPLIIASDTALKTAAGTTLRLSGAVTVNTGASVTPSGGGAVSYESSVTVQGGAGITFASPSHATSLTLADGGATAAVLPHTASSPTVMQFDSLSIGTSSTLDLANNELLTNTALSTIRMQISTGKLITSAAGGALGSVDNGSGSVEVLFTLLGDTNLDGNVNVTDLANLAGNYGDTSGGVWAGGDFDYDGIVNVADLADLAGNFGDTLPPAGGAVAAAAVPEPPITGLLAAAVALLWFPRPHTRRRGLG